MNNQATQLQLRHRPLKLLYPQVELRVKYRQNKMQTAKSSNCVFIRFEPSQKYCKMEETICVNIIAPISYQMGYLIGTLRDRLLKQKAKTKFGLSEEQSLFLFVNSKLMTSFKQKIGPFWQANKEKDNILYIEYSDSAPF